MTDKHIKCGDVVRVISTGHKGRAQYTALEGTEVRVKLHNYPMWFKEHELEHVEAPPANPFQVGDLVIKKEERCGFVTKVHEVIYTVGELVYLTPNFCAKAESLLLYCRIGQASPPSPVDTIISAFNDMEKEIDGLKAELADLNKQLLRSRAETQHAIAIHEHYKIFHPVH